MLQISTHYKHYDTSMHLSPQKKTSSQKLCPLTHHFSIYKYLQKELPSLLSCS